jgi:hypothetical protein
MPPRGFLLRLRGRELEAVQRRFDLLGRSSGLPELHDLVRILAEEAGYRTAVPRPAGAGTVVRLAAAGRGQAAIDHLEFN